MGRKWEAKLSAAQHLLSGSEKADDEGERDGQSQLKVEQFLVSFGGNELSNSIDYITPIPNLFSAYSNVRVSSYNINDLCTERNIFLNIYNWFFVEYMTNLLNLENIQLFSIRLIT